MTNSNSHDHVKRETRQVESRSYPRHVRDARRERWSDLAQPREPKRITVVEDHVLFAEALDIALTLQGHEVRTLALGVVGAPTQRLCSAVLSTRPQVVLLDLDLGAQSSGMKLIGPLQRAGIAVVVVTSCTDEARWGECLWHGARAVLPKATTLSHILATIQCISENQAVIPHAESDRLLHCFQHHFQWAHQARERLDSLTPRERQILAALMRGRHVREIARDAFVAEATVRTQVKSVLAKLEVSSQLAAVGLALKAQWQGSRESRTA